MQLYRLEGDCRGGSSLELDLQVPLGNKQDMKQQCTLAAKKANWILECIRQDCGQQVEGCYYSTLLSTDKTYLDSHCKKDMDILKQVQQRVTKLMRDWST